MPRILKKLLRPDESRYVFQPASELVVDVPKAPEPAPFDAEEPLPGETGAPPDGTAEEESPPLSAAEQEISFARVQAEAILRDARQEADSWRAQARREFAEQLELERSQARQDGYAAGYAEGMATAMAEGKKQCDELARQQTEEVKRFLETAAREKLRMLEDTREEMRDLALAVAEKVIRVSLKNSSDILLRMVDAATDTHKRCEWAHIYVADCDLNGKAYTAPELAAALGHVSGRIRIIPMADDESGTCIVELPDVILDASVSTQMANIREVVESAALDRDEGKDVSFSDRRWAPRSARNRGA